MGRYRSLYSCHWGLSWNIPFAPGLLCQREVEGEECREILYLGCLGRKYGGLGKFLPFLRGLGGFGLGNLSFRIMGCLIGIGMKKKGENM